MTKAVEKKILPRYFDAIIDGKKTFELRKDEDDIQEGDTLVLKEWLPIVKYTGRYIVCTVTYVLRDAKKYGLKKGYCIISFNNVFIVKYEKLGYKEASAST